MTLRDHLRRLACRWLDLCTTEQLRDATGLVEAQWAGREIAHLARIERLDQQIRAALTRTPTPCACPETCPECRAEARTVAEQGEDEVDCECTCNGRPPWEAECDACGEWDCPHGDPLHYHHGGCPSCDAPAASERPERDRENDRPF